MKSEIYLIFCITLKYVVYYYGNSHKMLKLIYMSSIFNYFYLFVFHLSRLLDLHCKIYINVIKYFCKKTKKKYYKTLDLSDILILF